MTLPLINQLAYQLLPAYGDREVALNNAWLLVEKITGKNKVFWLTQTAITLTNEQQKQLEQWVHDIVHNHKPLQYILGTVPFLDLILEVKPPTLIPRPETEQWCAQLIATLQPHAHEPLKILDLCTGSGCIALAVAQVFPNFKVWAVDIAPEALALAKKNAEKNKISWVNWVCADLTSEHFEQKITENFTQKFDVIIANPPYITEDEYAELEPVVKQWEDPRALVCSDHGLKIIRQIVDFASRNLQSLNMKLLLLWIEVGYRQAQEVTRIFEKAGFSAQSYKDLAGKERVVRGKLVVSLLDKGPVQGGEIDHGNQKKEKSRRSKKSCC